MVAGINPLATVLRVPNGALGAVDAARQLSMDAIAEATAVASAKGIRLAFDPRERFDATTQATAKMRSGTLLDSLRGRRTEIDAISGAIAAEGERLGVETPVTRMLWRLVKAIEATHTYRV
jgi:2-dehydropantoate 2-reductase